MNIYKSMFKSLTVGLTIGILYLLIEFIFKSTTGTGSMSISMMILSGIVGMLIDLIDELFPKVSLLLEATLGMFIATMGEFITGSIVNLDFSIWNYNHLWGTFAKGQCNIFFSLAWFGLSIVAVVIGNDIRTRVFKEERARYHWI